MISKKEKHTYANFVLAICFILFVSSCVINHRKNERGILQRNELLFSVDSITRFDIIYKKGLESDSVKKKSLALFIGKEKFEKYDLNELCVRLSKELATARITKTENSNDIYSKYFGKPEMIAISLQFNYRTFLSVNTIIKSSNGVEPLEPWIEVRKYTYANYVTLYWLKKEKHLELYKILKELAEKKW